MQIFERSKWKQGESDSGRRRTVPALGGATAVAIGVGAVIAALATPALATGSTPISGGASITSSGTTLQASVVKHAKADLDSRPYSWAAGHGAKPGPTDGQCEPSSVGNAGCRGLKLYGFDCSGFTRWVYYQAGGKDLLGAGNTSSQIARMHKTSKPVPGDLAFFGTSTTDSDHVGVYIGAGKMINAFETGTRIEVNTVTAGGHLLGYWHY